MITVECFNGLPTDYESFLIQKYDSYFITCRYLEVYHSMCDFHSMLMYDDSVLKEVIIYGINGKTSTCFNSLAKIDESIIDEFRIIIFSKHEDVQKIIIEASYKHYDINRAILSSRFNDYIITLPSTLDDYYKSLGRSTRQHVKNRKVRLLNEYPNAQFICKYKTDIDKQIIEQIIQLNIDRMLKKGKIPGRNNSDVDDFFSYSQHYGCVSYIEIDGKVLAGCISTILDKRIFSHVIAHDSEFSKYSLGEVCALYLIQVSIENELLALHSLWGESDMKNRLLAKPSSVYSYIIYKNYSIGYLYTKIKVFLRLSIEDFRNSKYSKPIRDAIKSFRMKRIKMIFMSLSMIINLAKIGQIIGQLNFTDSLMGVYNLTFL